VDVPPARSTTSRTRSASSVSNMARALCTAAAIAGNHDTKESHGSWDSGNPNNEKNDT
jgi:hypothetical protein